MPGKRVPLPPRPRPSWRTEPNAPQIGVMAEDLLGVAFMAATGGSGTVARPRRDNGVDLYMRRLRTMFTFPSQVKASLVVDQDGAATHYVPAADLHALSNGFLAFVHIPPPHDQLYQRIFLIPDDQFRKRCQLVTYHRIPCYRFTAQFAGVVDEGFRDCAVELDELPGWISTLDGWSRSIQSVSFTAGQGLAKAESHDIAAIGALWAESELERIALDRIMILEDRLRVDPVTFLVHDLRTQQFAGMHLRTAIFNGTRRIHFDVKQNHWFEDDKLWVLLVLLRPDRAPHDYVLLIPSREIRALGFSETLTLDPLTPRFRKYQLVADDFAKTFMQNAFGETRKGFVVARKDFQKAS